MLAWLVVYQGLTWKARHAKSGFSNALCLHCGVTDVDILLMQLAVTVLLYYYNHLGH
jgi:hypothetical protein